MVRKIIGYDRMGYPRYGEEDEIKEKAPRKKSATTTKNRTRKHTATEEPSTITVEDRKRKDIEKLKSLKDVEDELAKALLIYFGTFDEIKKIILTDNRSKQRLMEIPGIGDKVADSIIHQIKVDS